MEMLPFFHCTYIDKECQFLGGGKQHLTFSTGHAFSNHYPVNQILLSSVFKVLFFSSM